MHPNFQLNSVLQTMAPSFRGDEMIFDARNYKLTQSVPPITLNLDFVQYQGRDAYSQIMTLTNGKIIMKRTALLCVASVVMCLAAVLPTSAQTLKDRLVGTWIFVSAFDVQKDGTKIDRWGPNPKGTLMFDANGRYTQLIHRSDIPKFSGNSQNSGTADEYKTVMQNLVASFGTYSVNEADKMLITNVEGGAFPNQYGATQRRIISMLTADELRYTNAATNVGTTAEAVWRRPK